tara:strand:- start:108 stop:347 length:240 start_codon:yes stop_codon:yes gene_type:complete
MYIANSSKGIKMQAVQEFQQFLTNASRFLANNTQAEFQATLSTETLTAFEDQLNEISDTFEQSNKRLTLSHPHALTAAA